MKAKKFLYSEKFEGEPKLSDFELVEEELPELKDGEILTQAEYFSVDPYMRIYVTKSPLGITMIGRQIARVIQSKHPKFPIGSLVYGDFGWRTHTITNPDDENVLPYSRPFVLSDELGNVPASVYLGAAGMPGISGFVGFLDICRPKTGETVVVTGAAGAVGSIVGQIAKIKGCRVIGFAGSDQKCQWLEKELGFDKAINYKTSYEKLFDALKDAAPNGVDCYFDNVGGEISAMIYNAMNSHGRIAICGAISGYNGDLSNPVKVPSPVRVFVEKQLQMRGFLIRDPIFADRRIEARKQLIEWIKNGEIKAKETVTDGFENIPQAFIDMLRGVNFGKAIVKV